MGERADGCVGGVALDLHKYVQSHLEAALYKYALHWSS